MSITDDNDVQATRKLRLSFVPLDKNSKPGTVVETVITVEDDELEISLMAPGQTECRSPSPPESTPNCRIVVTESTGFVTLQLEASRLTATSLTVNLLYTADVGALTGKFSLADDTQEMSTMITVATNMTTRHTFKVPVIDDEIAAESTRTAQVVLQPGVGYTVSDTDNTVEIAVVDNDIATVSISSIRDRVTEGDTIVFTVTRDLATDQANSITLTLTHNGDFFSTAVLTAQRTIIVDLPAGQMDVMVEVATIDMDDSTTDGSLIAELIAVTSPIELGSTVSKVVIQHNNSVVTITGPNEESSVTVDENSSVTLALNVTPQINQSRDVNLSYMNVISGVPKMRTITVPAGRTSRSFSIPVGDDDIAAQSTRFFNVLLEPGDGYVVGTPSSVAVSVLNEDTATVSISPVRDTITEGEDAVFKVTLDIATAVPADVRVGFEFTGNEESLDAMDLGPVVVTFAAGETSTEVTVATNNNNNLVMDSSLSATLTDVTGSPLLISSTQRSATIMILDDTPVIGVTTLKGGDSIQVLESTGRVTLQLNINPTVNQDLAVNVLYSGDRGALTGDFSSVTLANISTVVKVPANAATQTFDVEVIDDRIAAEGTRTANIMLQPGVDYTVSDTASTVTIAVEDDDVATVSISPAIGTVTEGDTITIDGNPGFGCGSGKQYYSHAYA